MCGNKDDIMCFCCADIQLSIMSLTIFKERNAKSVDSWDISNGMIKAAIALDTKKNPQQILQIK